MPLYTPQNTIKVRRAGQPFWVEPGKVFDFTEAEAASALASVPGCLVKYTSPEIVSAPAAAAEPEAPKRGRKAKAATVTTDDEDEDGEI
jgi:hypothetical protein